MDEKQIDLSTISTQIVKLIPDTFIQKYKTLPLRFNEDDALEIAVSDSIELDIIDEIKLLIDFDIATVVYPDDEIQRAIDALLSVEKSAKQSMINMQIKKRLEERSQIKGDENRPIPVIQSNQPVVKLLSSIIEGAITQQASDIHIEPQEPNMRVRYRIDGVLRTILTVPSQIQQNLISRAKIIADMDITEKRSPQDGHYSHLFKGQSYDIRFSCIPTVRGEKMVLRILDKSRMTLGLNDLGFSENSCQKLGQFANRPFGIVLVTGPTGSGKTTTLYSLLNTLDSSAHNIVTAEDPVEYRLPGINQTQINSKIGLSFAGTLRSFLRQDPNIILVGEIRDYETAEIAIQAALTGHLVLSTLHTNNAAASITRLMDMGVEPFLIATTLVGVVAQRLARKVCGNCQGTGCSRCHDTGMTGRTVLYELLEINQRIRSLIHKDVSTDQIAEVMEEENMMTFNQCGKEKVDQKVCLPEEVSAIIG